MKGFQWSLVIVGLLCAVIWLGCGNDNDTTIDDDATIIDQIAFSSNRDKNWEIYVMNTDGGNVLQLTNSVRADGGPAWSPDGTKIAFDSNHGGDSEIYMMTADGGNVLSLTYNAEGDGFPAWSPDGTNIAFVSERDGGFEIYVMTAEG
ncbi:hypothetical protein F4X33_17280, partial [Candidatus Poribacteria bacterium]|nr:hypothetical protein [Candidatus Poribacteria bacterium]